MNNYVTMYNNARFENNYERSQQSKGVDAQWTLKSSTSRVRDKEREIRRGTHLRAFIDLTCSERLK